MQKRKGWRILVGLVLMIAFVGAAFWTVFQYAGSWGVPYFSFTSDNGSHCENNLTGFTCSPLTLEDLEFYAEVDLPDDAVMGESSYTATHDYDLTAEIQVPKESASKANKALGAAYGRCVKNRASPLDSTGLTDICVRANDAVTGVNDPASRLYVVGAGVRKDGTYIINMAIESR